MEAQLAQYINRGMNQDISISKSVNEFAYENYNIRITPVNDNTLLSITNEKGPELLNNEILGNYLGNSIIDNILVLFTHNNNDNLDRIYRIEFLDNDTTKSNIIFEGELNFDNNYPIETLPYFENNNIKKVYFVDGRNYPRVINVATDVVITNKNTIDFFIKVNKFPTVSIEKKYEGVGLFPSGVIQYYFSYYNKYNQESGIIASTDLNYITKSDIGVSPDTDVVCSFDIEIRDIDTSFDYIRIYSVIRTSLNTTPIVKIVKDVYIKDSTLDSITITDDNTGDIISPDTILYLSNTKFKASTITQKDNTLFLGNIEFTNTIIDSYVEKVLQESIIDKNGIKESSLVYFDNKSLSSDDFHLDGCEEVIKTFKYGEIYRFALQFQDDTLEWTDPIWIGDKKCDVEPKKLLSGSNKVANAYISLPEGLSGYILENTNYKKYRVLIPEFNTKDKCVLAQGLVTPTVFNSDFRVLNTGAYAMASWITRPINGNAKFRHLEGLGKDANVEFDFSQEIQNRENKNPVYTYKTDEPTGNTEIGYIVSIHFKRLTSQVLVDEIGVQIAEYENQSHTDVLHAINGNFRNAIYNNYYSFTSNVKDEIIEYLHNIIIPKIKDVLNVNDIGLIEENAVQYLENCINKGTSSQYYKTKKLITDEGIPSWYSAYIKFYYSNDENEREEINVREITNDFGDYGLSTYIKKDSESTQGDKYKDTHYDNYYIDNSIVSLYSPDIESNIDLFNSDLKFRIVGIIPITSVYSDISLELESSGVAGFSRLDKKYLDNNDLNALVNGPLYYDNYWNGNTITSDVAYYYLYLWNKSESITGHDENSTIKGKPFTPITSVLSHKVIANKKYSDYTKYYFSINSEYSIQPTVFNSDQFDLNVLNISNENKTYAGNHQYILSTESQDEYNINVLKYNVQGTTLKKKVSPVSIKYNTTPHIVFQLRKDADNNPYILPYLPYNNETKWNLADIYKLKSGLNYRYPWYDYSKENIQYKQDTILEINKLENPYLFIGEVYRNIDYNNLYGGTSKEALSRISWIPASDSWDIQDHIEITYGDTYYQRYDCLTSYPSTEEDKNSVVDITSFMVETYINLEGRYDKNINNFNILNARKTNYNKINSVYSQQNNFFKYSILPDKFKESIYYNQFIWSLTKNPESIIDYWTNINTVNAMNLDGRYGKLNKIISFNNSLLAFQDKAISSINFNNRTALSTNTGVPLVISNTGVVDSTSIITSTNGCLNKQSMCIASSGLYFIDYNNKSLLCINKDGISDISRNGMSIWFKENIKGNEILSYDYITHDIYISNDLYCLVYNEDLKTFTSFMDYQYLKSICNIKSNSIALYDNNSVFELYNMFKGDYNTTFNHNQYNGYYISYKVNPEPFIDKIFGSIEYTSDCFSPDSKIDSYENNYDNFYNDISPFNKLSVWNEYQRGITDSIKRGSYPNFTKKFRVWRVDIPRDSKNKRDRMRNPWLMIKLDNKSTDNYKMVFHNLLVKYYK